MFGQIVFVSSAVAAAYIGQERWHFTEVGFSLTLVNFS